MADSGVTISKDVFETYTIDGHDVPLDLIIWRRYKRMTPGLVEATYDFNKGLAQVGMFLPHNSSVSIPVETPSPTFKVPLKRLF